MRVYIEHKRGMRMVEVFLLDDVHEKADVLTGSDEWTTVDWPRGTQPPYAIRLPDDVFASILAEAKDFSPPSSAMGEHLADARQVRDRLLSMLEVRGIR